MDVRSWHGSGVGGNLGGVADGEFHDAALVLVAHGSTRNADSATSAWVQGDALRRLGVFREVHVAFLLLEPSVAGILRAVFAPRVFVVPLFVSEGWFTREVIPTQLGLRAPEQADFDRVQAREGRLIHYCAAVGTHDSMTEVLVRRAREVVARYPFPRAPRGSETAVMIAGHGTSYRRDSREAIERQVARLRERGEFAEVHGVFLEEEPGVDRVWEMTECRNLVLVPFFMSDGLHTREDIPVLLGEPADRVRERVRSGRAGWRNPGERGGKRLWYAEPVGLEPGLPEVVLELARDAARDAAGADRKLD